LMIPLAAIGVVTYGWRTGLVAAGLVCLAMAPVAHAWLRRAGPPTAASAVPSLRRDLAGLVRSPTFQLLFWGFVLCGFTSIGVIETHFLPYTTFCGVSPTTGANAFGLLSAFNLVGVLLAGWLSDRMSRPWLLGALFGLRALTFWLLLGLGADPSRLFLFAALFGLFDYATSPVVASIVASHLGLRAMGLAMGLLGLGHQIGSALGALGGGIVFDLFTSYSGLWSISIALALVASALSLAIARRPAMVPA
ncbi:MAG: MFS transporter, partial [Burkholderiales bacterium]